MASFFGDSGDNSFTGVDGENNFFKLDDGGEDTVRGGDASDLVVMGGALDRGDRLNGGASFDVVVLDGDYSSRLVIGKPMMTNFEALGLLHGHDYDLSFADGVVKADTQFQVDSTDLQADDSVVFDGSRESDAHFLFFLGGGRSTFTGGDLDDTFVFISPMGEDNRLDGGKGVDVVDVIDTGAEHLFRARELKNIEVLLADADGDFHWTMNDENVAGGRTLQVDATPADSLFLDATAETDGLYQVFGSSGNDTITGGLGADTFYAAGGDDVLIGRDGADVLNGGDGSDTFVYRLVGESTRKHADLITDLTGEDFIDLSNIDARTDKVGNQAFHQVAAFTGEAGELKLTFNAHTGLTTLAGDVDGDGVADIVVRMTGDQTGFAGLVL